MGPRRRTLASARPVKSAPRTARQARAAVPGSGRYRPAGGMGRDNTRPGGGAGPGGRPGPAGGEGRQERARVPGGDGGPAWPASGRRGGLACRPGPQASTLHSSRPVKPASAGTAPAPGPGLWAGGAGARPASRGRPRTRAGPGRVPRRGHGGAHCEGACHDRASARRRAARSGHAWLRAPCDAARRICHGGLVPRAAVLVAYLQKSGFEGLFSLRPREKVLEGRKHTAGGGVRRRCHLDRLVVTPDVTCPGTCHLWRGVVDSRA